MTLDLSCCLCCLFASTATDSEKRSEDLRATGSDILWGRKPFVVLILSLCSGLDQSHKDHVLLHVIRCMSAGLIWFQIGWSKVCSTNSLCNMSKDKLASNYLVGILFFCVTSVKSRLNCCITEDIGYIFITVIFWKQHIFLKFPQLTFHWSQCFIFGMLSCVKWPCDCGCDCHDSIQVN